MSYNTRRSGPDSIGTIGQRRPNTNNFGRGNQQNKSPAQKPQPVQKPVPPQQQQKLPQQQPKLAQPQQKLPQQFQQPPQQFQPPPPQNQTPPNFNQQNQPQQEPPQPQIVEPIKADDITMEEVVDQIAPLLGGPGMEILAQDDSPKKKPWGIKTRKITKKERMRRRNLRLGKILCPKNAVMILNELMRNVTYSISDIPGTDNNQYKATVTVEGAEYVGFGRSKILAKNAAAELALRCLIKSKQLFDTKIEEDLSGVEDEKMVTDGPGETAAPSLPWQHVASFALYKLFSSWDEVPPIQNSYCPSVSSNTSVNGDAVEMKQIENRPAKKMPANPEQMNPLMLLHQMLPQTKFEELAQIGSPPNVKFSFQCTVDGQTFVGTGSNKKSAKKVAAFEACRKVLGVAYAPELYSAAV